MNTRSKLKAKNTKAGSDQATNDQTIQDEADTNQGTKDQAKKVPEGQHERTQATTAASQVVKVQTGKKPSLASRSRLEIAAQTKARTHHYEDQWDFADSQYTDEDLAQRLLKLKAKKSSETPAPPSRVYIVIDEQAFDTLYAKNVVGCYGMPIPDTEVPEALETPEAIEEDDEDSEDDEASKDKGDGENNEDPENEESVVEIKLPNDGIDRATLMNCSSLARDYFTWNPGATELHLPVQYPRLHDHNAADYKQESYPHFPGTKYYLRYQYQMAQVVPEQIEEYLIPWFRKLEKKTSYLVQNVPRPEIPKNLLDKIHLYNAMLQLGVPKFIQKPLVDALCIQMWQNKLANCELEALERTIGRFHGYAVSVLDPVLSALTGSYGLRTMSDRLNVPNPRYDGAIVARLGPNELKESRRIKDNYKRTTKMRAKGFFDKRQHLLVFTEEDPIRQYSDALPIPLTRGRDEFPNDTVINPAPLPVIGHCIRHWSQAREISHTPRAALLEFPLHIGRVPEYYSYDDNRKRLRRPKLRHGVLRSLTNPNVLPRYPGQ